MDRMRDHLTSLCVGWPVDQVNAIVAATLHELIAPMVYAEDVALFERHHADGLDVVIASSSGEEVVGPRSAARMAAAGVPPTGPHAPRPPADDAQQPGPPAAYGIAVAATAAGRAWWAGHRRV